MHIQLEECEDKTLFVEIMHFYNSPQVKIHQ